MKKYKTNQELFWANEFGKDYIGRNDNLQIIKNNTSLFSKILKNTSKINSIFEIGSNIGLNIHALQNLLSSVDISAIEINEKAYNILIENKSISAYNDSILNFDSVKKYDFVFSKGVLIHINPDELQRVYQKMYQFSKKYICIVEYYNPTPIEIDYRGHKGKLFKRDFAGELLDKYNDLILVDYGFVYHKDNNFPLDDLTWFLLEKKVAIK